jgi:hypothetical protein
MIFSYISFMEANEENGCGWVIKGPFTTNSQCIKFVHSIEGMTNSMRLLSNRFFGHLPYLMIQPCMYNRKECKVVVLNNSPVYLAGISTGGNSKSKNGVRRSFADFEELQQFASRAIEQLRLAAPFAITDGLFRVDIFQTAAGKMVVNEFESLDAEYQSSVSGRAEATYTFLEKYWCHKIETFCVL